MPDLKSSILALIRDHHKGKHTAITVSQVAYESLNTTGEIVDDRTIRKIIRELNFDGYPILSTVHYPYGIYYAATQEEINEYLNNLGSRMKAIIERMKAIDRIRAKEFIKGQMELF
jgi:capsule polysaccharide export protein KpsC/LpsZ